MIYLKQSTATTVRIGPFVDDSDGKTAETALTIAQADVRLSKNGGAAASKNDTTSATHDENGYYRIPLNTTDTGVLGSLRLCVSKSGALAVWEDFTVLAANVYDSLIGGGDNLEVDVTYWKGSAAPANTGDAYARLGAPAGASVSADVAAIKTDSGAIKAKTDGLNFTGTDVKATLDGEPVALSADQAVNVTKIAGAAVSTSTAQVGVNVVSQANIDFGATQKASIATAVSGLVIENSKTFLQVVRSMFAILCGKTSGGGTDTLKFRDNADLKDRVTVTVDANKNRTGITLDPS